MAISVECESCGAGFKVADTFAGKRGKCPKCGAVFTASPVDPASSLARASVSSKRPHESGSSVARKVSSQSSAEKQPETSKRKAASGSSSNVRPAGTRKRGAGPPPTAVRAVPVGSVPDAIPVGGLPGGTSAGPVVVRPAMGPGVSVGKSSTTRAKKYQRKKGTPVIIWVIIVVGGLSATGGWIYVATREKEQPLDQAVTANNPTASGKQTSDKPSVEGAKDVNSAASGSLADREAKAATDGRKLPIVPEAEQGGEPAENLDAALAGGGDLGPKNQRRPTTPRTANPSTPTVANGKDEEAPATVVEAVPVTAEEITALAEACKQNAWKADSKEQYAQLAALASGMMNYADDAARDVALKLLNGPLSEVVWTTDRVSRINRNAARDMDKIGAGCFIVAEVSEQVDGGALLKLVSTEAMIKLEMSGAQLALARPGKNFLLIGLIEPESYDLPASEGGEARRARVINAMFRMGITEIYDRETSTIGPAGGGE